MKRFLALLPGLILASSAAFVHADEPTVFSLSDDALQEVSVARVGEASQAEACQKEAGCETSCSCDTKGAKNGKGGCSCYLFGPDEPFQLYSGHNCLGISVGGWTQLGYHNRQTPLSTTLNDGGAFNDHPDRLNLHQQWLWVEKAADADACSWDWGFRMDLMYGNDASKTQAFGGTGWDTTWNHGAGYGWAMPQLYFEVAKGDLSVIMGHFYTLVGYEVVTAPGNFFYSHALTMFNSEPFTHTGVLATYGYSDRLEFYGGWTLGWDTGFENFNQGNNFLGGASYSVSDNLSVTYIATSGNLGSIGQHGYSHSIVADASLTDNLNYVLQTDYKRVDSTQDDQVGINQYLFYALNDCWALGGRMEWWKDQGQSHYAATGGINYRPHANLVLRPEVRHDWQPFANFDQTTVGIDAILTY